MDLTNPRWMGAKAGMMAVAGAMSFGLCLLPQSEGLRAALQLVMVWAFCRAYYFAFYVIEHYVDSTYRFAGLLSFLQYAIHKRHERATGGPTGNPVGVSADPPDDASDSQPPQAPVSN